MRIIKHGNTSPLYVKPTRVADCPRCSCKFTVEDKDTYLVKDGDYRSSGMVQKVTCPECGKKNILPNGFLE